MSDENKAVVGVKGVRPNFTPNEVKGYRIRPDQWNWSVVQVKVKGAGSKDAGKEYEDTPMAYTRDLYSAVSYIMRTAGALGGRIYQDEEFKARGVAADLNALTQGFRDASDIAVRAIEELEQRIISAGIPIAEKITEENRPPIINIRTALGEEIKDVRMAFKVECNKILDAIGGIAERAIEYGLGISDDKGDGIRRAANSEEWNQLRADYKEAFDRAMQAVKDLYARLEEVGVSSKNFNQYLIKAEGGSLEVTEDEAEADIETENGETVEASENSQE